MTRNGLGIASALLVAAMAGIGLWVASGLPDDARLPIHWNARGQADGFADKWTALLLMPGTVAAAALLLYFLPALEPRARGLSRSQGLYLASWAGMLIVLTLAYAGMIAAALGHDVGMTRLMLAGLGLLFLLIGNPLGKSRRMYMVGIRTPWTLASEEVWIKTHRLGGKLMVAAGLFLLLFAAVDPGGAASIAALAIVLAAVVLVPVLYSYYSWRRERQDDQPSG